MDPDDADHRLLVREPDVVEEAAAQERVRKLLLVVAGDDDDRPVDRVDRLLRLVDVELHAVELLQEIVRKLDVRLVDLVDEEDRTRLVGEGFPELAVDDVVVDVVDPAVAELRVAKARDRVVFVEPLARFRDRLDVPLDEGGADCVRHLLGEHGLARAGLSLDEQRPFKDDGGVHREHQVLGGDVGIGSFESSLRHRAVFSSGQAGRRATV